MNEEEQEKSNKDESVGDQVNPVSFCMTRFLHCLKDTEEALSIFFNLAIKIHNRRLAKVQKGIEKGSSLASEENDLQTQAAGIKLLSESFRKYDRIVNANVPETLEKALFLNIFSDFDAFTGDLLVNLYKKRPELLSSLEKSISLSEILLISDIDELKDKVVSEEIEAFRRKSYVEQFEDLEKRFGLSLKNFDRWPNFVEATQRRNLFMHCDGVVNNQYLAICKKNNVDSIDHVRVGDKLEFDDNYLFEVIDLMLEVSVKLGHVLWRKLVPAEIEGANDHLNGVIYDHLSEKEWRRAATISDFFLSLPNHANDLKRKICTINNVIAHENLGNKEQAQSVLSGTDWSASIFDFRLADAVLRQEYSEAYDLMVRIGKEGELVDENAYHEWPLFNQFRESDEFMKGYEAVYGYTFLSEAKRTSEDRRLEVSADASSSVEMSA